MAKLNTADIGFEDQIWKAADKMRGNIDASEYKSVVLGLIILKYISDKFDARNLGSMVTRKLRELTDGAEGDIMRIANTYKAFAEGTLADEKGFCAVVDVAKIAEQDFILTPGRYVGIAEQEQDSEPFEEKMQRLTTELATLFKQSHTLET